jgi:protein-S-isoprenylcysteine O-methyltransferase Ste14
VLAFSAAWFVLAHAFVLLVEEPGLRRRFGEAYEQYCARVPRWIPRAAAAVSIAVLLIVLEGQ